MIALLRIYGRCLSALPRDIGRSPWVLLVPIIYSVLELLASTLVGLAFPGALGLVGGFVMGLVQAVLGAAFLYFVDEVVNGSTVRIRELPNSFRRHFSPVISAMFVAWIGGMILGLVLQNQPIWIELGIYAVIFILFNATPEIIYQRRVATGLEIFRGSIEFIQTNWIEWFIPNVLLGALVFGVVSGRIRIPSVIASPLGATGTMLLGFMLTSAVVFIFFVFRGHLFAELDGSSRRLRKFVGR